MVQTTSKIMDKKSLDEVKTVVEHTIDAKQSMDEAASKLSAAQYYFVADNSEDNFANLQVALALYENAKNCYEASLINMALYVKHPDAMI